MSNASLEHQAPLEVLRKAPSFVVELLRLVGHPAEGADLSAKIEESDLTVAVSSARRADMVLTILDRSGRPRQIVVIEVQRRRARAKLRSWPLYVAHLTFKSKVPVTLLVLALDRAVARWARRPRAVGPNMVFTPLVVGPDDFPEVLSGEEAVVHWARATLTAIARLEDPSAASPDREREEQEVLRICEAFLRTGDSLLRDTYVPMIHGAAGDEFRGTLNALLEAYGMNIDQLLYKKGEAAGKAQAEVATRAETLLRQLRRRGFEVDAVTKERVQATTDIAVLDAWLDRVLDATRLEDVFDA